METVSGGGASLSLCVTAYQEAERHACEWIKECLAPAIQEPLVAEIVVCNDGTPDWPELAAALRDVPKLRFVQNPERLQVFGNKLESVWQATSEWVLMCDSDNVMGDDYYRALEALRPWDRDTWYCASRAGTVFDYRPLIGEWKLPEFLEIVPRDASMFWCFCNTGNQFVHRPTFLSLFGHLRGKRFDREQPDYLGEHACSDEDRLLAYGACDSFFMAKSWLLSGRTIHCGRDLAYLHRTDTGNLSNFNRGPEIKEQIPNFYFMEMYDQSHGEQHRYTFLKRNGYARFRREDGRIVTLDRATGRVVIE